ncbi:glycosyltransferase family 4 protein [Mycolicibacterium sp. SCSIO 43805]|uniref:glycosyltransferase family 4 protein n=1 Tax=Mycolicibacterium sp. SCSIO 43805 TaxID=3378074 RepID=UPI003AB61DA8
MGELLKVASSVKVPPNPVVLVNHSVEPPGKITGISRYTFGLLGALMPRIDARFILATTWRKQQLPKNIASGVDTVVTLPYISSKPLNYIRQRREIPLIARQFSANVVYATNPTCPAVKGIPSVITVHDLYLDVLPELYKRRHRLWWKLLFADAARQSSRIAFASANSAADAVRLYPFMQDKVSVVAGAGALPHTRRALDSSFEGAPYVVLIGNVTPNKNVAFVVDALKVLYRRGTPIRALHIGTDVSGDLARAVSEGAEGLLQCLGNIDDADADAVLRHATALVQPSRYEGFGLPIIEAHERGVPVIASDIGVFREIAGEGAIFIPLGDVYRLADALHAITTNPTLRSTLSAKAEVNSRRFTWQRSADAAVSVIRDLVEGER